jgi:hypothetical protein
MIFITDNDIKKQCTSDDLQVLSQSDNNTKNSSEASAISFFRGFLKRYDVNKIFVNYNGSIPDPDPRNASLLMFLIDYFLYILYAAQPDRLIPDIRVRRRDEAVEWLRGVQRGEISPDLPTVDDDTMSDINNPIKWNSNKKISNPW